MDSFIDLHHLQKLRTDLWSTPGYGQAAVMVGSGFSLNAQPLPGERRSFPLWRHLAEAMFDKLYPGDPADNVRSAQKIRAVAGLGAMTLASEYEAAFGRQALNQFVVESIPDDRYMPGDLHRLLLELPWADVFTTNYDTLLERTRVDERYYQLLSTADDLPGSAHPRIMKLHGSFPSQRPFILTNEDYRTYPRRFAPFVNTVQQSLMENTLVLLGFSGDDPNFLFWSGWVRDELGPNAPRIYLCGVLNLTDPQKRLLEQRGVIPIDLTPVVAQFSLPPGVSRHALALEWMLRSLKNGRPNNPLRWPTFHRKAVTQPTHFPKLLPPSSADIPDEPLFPQPNQRFADQIPALLKAWRLARESYPGWLIMPHENREHIWKHTRHWLHQLIAGARELKAELRLVMLFELNWRLERALVPLFLDWVKVIEDALSSFDIEHCGNAALDPEIEEAWMNLSFAVTREAREDYDAVRHDKWQERLRAVAARRPEWLARWHYEHCLHALWRLDQHELRTRIEQWRASPDLLVWQLRRASILAEIGDLAEAEQIAADVLRRIRSGLLGRRQQIELLSLEGWTMRLLGSVHLGYRLSSNDEEWDRFRDRWLDLASSRCDPWDETRALELALKGATPALIAYEERKQGFDYGVTYMQHFVSDNVTPLVPAFALLRLYEEAGLPMRAGIVSLSSEGVVNACRWIMAYAPLWAAGTLVRVGKKDPLRDAFDRVRIATLTAGEVETLMTWLMPAIRAAVEFLPMQPSQHGETFSERVVEELVDLLSRLCMKMSAQQLEEVFQLALQLHKHPGVRLHVALHDVCQPFFRRLFDASSHEQLCSWLPYLLAVPTLSAEDANRSVWESQVWPDPFNELEPDMLKGCPAETLRTNETATRRLEELLRDTEFSKGVERQRAVNRLWVLFAAGLLSEKQSATFGKALWAQIDSKTGLPSDTIFYPHVFLNLPAPSSAARTKAVREWLLNSPPPRWFIEKVDQNGKKSFELRTSHVHNPVVVEVLAATRSLSSPVRNLLTWSENELRALLQRAIEWWDADKGALRVFSDQHELRRAAKELVPFFQRVIMPHLPRQAANEWAAVERVLTELENNGISVLGCLPAMLVVWPERADSVAVRIGKCFQQGEAEAIEASAEAIHSWAQFSSSRKVPPLPADLLTELCKRVEFRQEPGLKRMIEATAQLVREAPKIVNSIQVDEICRGLEYLLRETQLTMNVDQMVARIPAADRPLYRARSARLAFELYNYFQKRNTPIPPVLESWKAACQADSLPEVRRMWR